MELTLLGVTGLAAFLVVGGAVMLIAAFRRTIELRRALTVALARIDKLEDQIESGAVALAGPEQRASITKDEAPLRITGPPPPPPAPPSAPAKADAPPTSTSAAIADPLPAPAGPSEAVREAAGAAPEKNLTQVSIAPPRTTVTVFVAALAVFAPLAAAREGLVPGFAGVALALVVALALIGVAEWRRSAEPLDEGQALPDQATLTALAGLGLMLAAFLYGRFALDSPQPIEAFAGVAVAALCAAALSARHGFWLMGAGVAVAAAAPLLAPLSGAGPIARYVFLALFAALAGVLAARRGAAAWIWATGAVVLGWGALGALRLDAGGYASWAAPYFAVLAGLALAYAWRGGKEEAPPFPFFWGARWPEANASGQMGCALAALCLAAVILFKAPAAPAASASVAALAAAAVGAAAARPPLWVAALGSALLSAWLIALWPAGLGGVAPATNLVVLAAGLGLIFSLGGWTMMARARDPAPGATLAALAPIAVFAAAHWRVGAAYGPSVVWAGAAVLIGVVNALSYLQLAKEKPDAAAPFAAGAALGLACAAYVITPYPYAPLALALAMPLIAFIDRWHGEAGLRYAALAIGVLLFVRVVTPQFFIVTATPMPVLTAHLAAAAVATFLAGLLFARGSAGQQARAAQYPFALGVLLLACLATLALRRFVTAGDIGAPYTSLAEMGANTLIWLLAACVLAARFPPPARTAMRAIEFAAFAGAAIHVLLAGLILINPWWGLAPAATPGWAGFNVIELGYAAPALLFLAYAQIRASQAKPARAGAAIGVGVTLLFTALILELRRLYHGAAMAAAPVTGSEAWVYSIATLGFAAMLMAFATRRELRALRLVSLALALAALVKMAFFDIVAISGLARIAGTLALLTAAGATMYFYRRYVLPDGPARFKAVNDPNLMPPG